MSAPVRLISHSRSGSLERRSSFSPEPGWGWAPGAGPGDAVDMAREEGRQCAGHTLRGEQAEGETQRGENTARDPHRAG